MFECSGHVSRRDRNDLNKIQKIGCWSAIGKFGLRGLSQSLTKAYAKDGVHIVHVRLDCDLDVPIMREAYGPDRGPDDLASPDAVAESYWLTHLQPRTAWSNEIEIRPYTENWTY